MSVKRSGVHWAVDVGTGALYGFPAAELLDFREFPSQLSEEGGAAMLEGIPVV